MDFPGGASGLKKKIPPASAGDVTGTGSIPESGRSLEEGLATRYSILAWRIPWTEEPGGSQSIGSQRVRQDWSDLTHTQRLLMEGRHCSWGVNQLCFPPRQQRIKATFLLPPNSISIFFIRLQWADKAKNLTSNTFLVPLQLAKTKRALI